MNFLRSLIELFLHLDTHLSAVIAQYGTWTYALMFLIIFCETGLVVTPFLPGDTLLFAAGTFAALQSLHIGWVIFIFAAAAIGGDTVNYWIGYKFGAKIFSGRYERWIKKEHLQQTQRFYDKNGGKAILLARFMPIVRTFAPFVAGVGSMHYPKFLMYNVIGGLAWVLLFSGGGYFFGNLPFVKTHFSWIVLGIIVLSILLMVVEWWRSRQPSSGAT